MLDLETHAAKPIVSGRVRFIVTGHKTQLFITPKDGAVFATDRVSPTDPTLLMLCHEGPWHKVDRIWTMHADGSHVTLIHKRTVIMEIAGHEFWSADGQWIYLFRPELIPDDGTLGSGLIHPGVLRAQKLANIAKHKYHLEPNVSFRPDRKRGSLPLNMFGATYGVRGGSGEVEVTTN